jgi:hypothetical protein
MLKSSNLKACNDDHHHLTLFTEKPVGTGKFIWRDMRSEATEVSTGALVSPMAVTMMSAMEDMVESVLITSR